MALKRKNDEHSISRQRALSLLLIGIGVLILTFNTVFSINARSAGQVIGDIASTIGDNVGDTGQQIGETAGTVGHHIGEAAGEIGHSVGKTFGSLGESIGRSAGNLWPLLLVIVGLALIVRRPAAIARHETWHDTYAADQDTDATGGKSWVK